MCGLRVIPAAAAAPAAARNCAATCARRRGRSAIENIRLNASGCLDRCELGPNMVIYPEGVWYHYDSHRGHRRDPADASDRGRPGRPADAAARPEAAGALTRLPASARPTRSSPRRRRPGAPPAPIVRLSGPGAAAARFGDRRSRRRRRAAARRVRLHRPGSGEPLDDGLVLWFPGPAQRHRRGCRRAASAWQPRGARRASSRRCAARAAASPSPANSPAAPF